MSMSQEEVTAFFKKYLFLSEGQPMVQDLVTIIPFIGFFLCLRAIVQFAVLGIAPIIIKFNNPIITDDDLELRKHRLADQCVKILFHLTAALFAFRFFGSQPWWIPNLWHVTQMVGFPLGVLEKVYYMYQAGYHVHSLVHFFLLETKRKADDFVMGLHHVVTIVLIVASYLGGSPYFQFGVTVFFVHDASDVFIANVKILNYLEAQKFFIALGLVVSLGTWLYFRIYTFGMNIILVAYRGALRKILFNKPENFDLKIAYFGLIFGALMTCLWLMHVYWLKAIISSLFRIATKTSNFDASDSKEAQDFKKRTKVE